MGERLCLILQGIAKSHIHNMKKLILSIALVMGIAATTIAQDKGAFRIGPKFGIGASFVRGDNLEGIDPAPVFNLGATGDYWIADMVSIGGTIGARQKAYIEEVPNIFGNYNFELFVYNNYLGVDVVPKLHLGTSSTSFYVGAGPRFDFILGTNVFGGNANDDEKAAREFTEELWKESESPVIGLTGVVGIAGPKFFFEIEYISDLTDSFDGADQPAFNVISTNFGWRF